MIDKLCKAIDKNLGLTEKDVREINDRLTDTTIPIEEYQGVRDWYKPMLNKLIDERRKIPKEERLQRFREDSVDEVDTTDLENWTIRGLYRNAEGTFVDPESGDLIRDNINIKLNRKVKAEMQVQERIEDRLHSLYDEEILSDAGPDGLEGLEPGLVDEEDNRLLESELSEDVIEESTYDERGFLEMIDKRGA